VEGELWERLKPVLLHGSWWARRDCALVLYVDSSEELGEEKARTILESLGSAWMLPDGDQSARLAWDYWQTVRTHFFRRCLDVLAEAGPITLAHLQSIREPLSDIQRKCLMLARALRGDEEARPEYCRVDVTGALRHVGSYFSRGRTRMEPCYVPWNNRRGSRCDGAGEGSQSQSRSDA
jgi:hypothetical protein